MSPIFDLYILRTIRYISTMQKMIFNLVFGAACIAILPPSLLGDQYPSDGYVGSSECRPCHEKFYKLWAPSHHGRAMMPFNEEVAKSLQPMKSAIEVDGHSFIIELTDNEGVLKEISTDDAANSSYPILHVMGGKNVYFFLIPLDRGRLQVAPIAYNVRTDEWYNSTASMVRHAGQHSSDEKLHWTDSLLTFNTTCHDCHVSQLDQNYNEETDTYHTTWKEPGINCETCHGPSAKHIEVCEAAAREGHKPEDLKLIRFHEDLTQSQRDASCAPCHAKMVNLTGDFQPGEEFFDHYNLVAYENSDFYPDGRDLGENYTMTGWMANPCVAAGKLECIHCHTSSGRFRFKDNPNQACAPCHSDHIENPSQHTHHLADGMGSQCTACHMPMTTFAHMVRSDHSFRPPAPAAGEAFGSPDACTLCHTDKDPAWATEYVTEWHGDTRQKAMLKLGNMISAAREQEWDKLPEILDFMASSDCDQVAKVSLLRLLDACHNPDKWPIIQNLITAPEPWVRSAAAAALRYDTSIEATRLLLTATKDQFRTVRIMAASSLLGRDLHAFDEEQRNDYEQAHDEYWKSLIIWPDQWSTHYNQALYYERTGDPDKALEAYTKATKLRGDVIQPLLNAAMIHAQEQRTDKAQELLYRAFKVAPTDPSVNYNLALLEAELGNTDKAESHLRTVLEHNPRMASAAYNLGILLGQQNKEEGLIWCKKAVKLVPDNPDFLSAYIYFLQQKGKMDEVIATLNVVIEKEYPIANAYFMLADIYLRQNKRVKAAEIYQKALKNHELPEAARKQAKMMEGRLMGPRAQ